jgi:hypothetical protein
VRFTWKKVVSMDKQLLKGEAQRFSADFPFIFHVRGPLSVGAISYKIWDVINEFPITLHTSGLESSTNGGMNF